MLTKWELATIAMLIDDEIFRIQGDKFTTKDPVVSDLRAILSKLDEMMEGI